MKTISNSITGPAREGQGPQVSAVTRTGQCSVTERIRIAWTAPELGSDIHDRRARSCEAVFSRSDLANLVAARDVASRPGIGSGFGPLAKAGLVYRANGGFALTGAGTLILATLADTAGLTGIRVAQADADGCRKLVRPDGQAVGTCQRSYSKLCRGRRWQANGYRITVGQATTSVDALADVAAAADRLYVAAHAL